MNQHLIKIKIAEDFTTAPGFRYTNDGPYSGEEFRNQFLEEHFQNENFDAEIKIDFDGVAGYATSFLEEIFGGLARMYGKERCFKLLKFISEEDPLLIDEINHYIETGVEL